MAGELDGKIALVTGTGAAIGEACAVRLSRGGAKAAVVEIDLEAARRVAEPLGEERTLAIPPAPATRSTAAMGPARFPAERLS